MQYHQMFYILGTQSFAIPYIVKRQYGASDRDRRIMIVVARLAASSVHTTLRNNAIAYSFFSLK